MKKLKRIFLILISIVAILFVSLYVFLQTTKPSYEGEIVLKNISKETKVYFDDFGVPHIYSDTQKDAMVALGYVHAQDRLWQMELLRRIAPGRLSELFGTKALKNDQFFAGLGIDENSEKHSFIFSPRSLYTSKNLFLSKLALINLQLLYFFKF
jgi:penicillin amidase